MIKATIDEGNVKMHMVGDTSTLVAEAARFVKAFHLNLKKNGKDSAATTFRTMVLNDSNVWDDDDESKEEKEPSLDEQLRDELERLLGEMAKLFGREDKKND